MTATKKENPNKRTIAKLTRWNKAEWKMMLQNASAADLDAAVFIRTAALGLQIASRRGLSGEAKSLLGLAIGALNEAGAPLNEICEQLRLGDIPLESTMHQALYKVSTALQAFDIALAELRRVADDVLDEVRRP